MKYSSTRLAVMALIVLCTVLIDIAWQFNLEKSARITAKFNLKQAQVYGVARVWADGLSWRAV